MNFPTVLPESGEQDFASLRKTGNPFTFEQSMSIFSRMVQGEAFDHKKLMATMEYELERGTLKTRLRDDGEMIFWFEVLHPINKYPELEKNSRLRDRVLAGEEAPEGH
jgi:hypothetical protein